MMVNRDLKLLAVSKPDLPKDVRAVKGAEMRYSMLLMIVVVVIGGCNEKQPVQVSQSKQSQLEPKEPGAQMAQEEAKKVSGKMQASQEPTTEGRWRVATAAGGRTALVAKYSEERRCVEFVSFARDSAIVKGDCVPADNPNFHLINNTQKTPSGSVVPGYMLYVVQDGKPYLYLLDSLGNPVPGFRGEVMYK